MINCNEDRSFSMENSENENIQLNNGDINENIQLNNNDTLIISEVTGKVVLPYTANEVQELLDSADNEFKDANEVIEQVFTRNLSDYKVQFTSRYVETMKLAREREQFSFTDSITLATEMMRKRYLHPAIISACRTLDELDVYLDCLDKNELDDFKIFKVKFELHPIVVKNKNKYGNHYNEETRVGLFDKIRKLFFKPKIENIN